MASPFSVAFAAALMSLTAGAAMACPDLAACGGMSRQYDYYSEQASFGPMVDGAYDQAAAPYGYDDQGYGPDQGSGYDQGAGYDQDPQAGPDAPPPYDPRYDAGANVYDRGGQAYGASSYGSRSYQSSSRSSSVSASRYGYDSGWRRVEGADAGRRGAYGGVSVESREYDSGWRVHQGPTEIVRGGARTEALCPPGSAYQRPHPRYGCPLAAGNPVPVPSSFFYDTGGVGPIYGGGGGGGGGGMVIVGGARAGAFAFASARASASVHVGGHFGGHGGRGCGCGGGHGGHH